MINVSRLVSLAVLPIFLLSCSDDTSLVDTPLPQAQIGLTGLRLSVAAIDTDTMSVVPGRDKLPDDVISLPLKVWIHVDTSTDADAEIVSIAGEITVDGKSDVLAESRLNRISRGYFSGIIMLNIRRGDVGDYRVNVRGRNSAGIQVSTTTHAKLHVTAGSRPPFFCGINAPDTVSLPADGFIVLKLSACVDDSSGRADIKRVLFNSFLPNGQASSGNPFLMFDDGTQGDETAGDGTYTLDVKLPSTTQKGKYRFEFYAYDLSNRSAFLARSIVVK